MQARSLPSDLDTDAVARIDDRLDALARETEADILWAIESGSRAWGFPSPDSDYDCRFIYRRPLDQYLSLEPPRDVLETPLDADLDVNGWDIGKALRLFLKGNAVVIEWLMSPIVYRGDPAFRDEFLALARRHADRNSIGRHYLHLGERQRRTYFGDGKDVPLKKIFYALRPAAALRWMRLHPLETTAPMHFPTLMRDCAPPDDVVVVTRDLMRRKAATRELGADVLPAAVADFVDREFDLARVAFERDGTAPTAAARREADAFFRRVLRAVPAQGKPLTAG